MTQTTYYASRLTSESGDSKPCRRCGIDLPLNVVAKRNERGAELSQECSDCRHWDKPYATVGCVPWQGEIDNAFRPIDDAGNLYMHGTRSCGKADCINRNHVTLAPGWKKTRKPQPVNKFDLIAEQFDISYRTGKVLTYEQLIKALRKEARTK